MFGAEHGEPTEREKKAAGGQAARKTAEAARK